MKNPLTIPFEFPHTADGKYTSLLTEDGMCNLLFSSHDGNM